MIHIWVRQTLDWHDAEAARAQIRPDFLDKADGWDATFDMPYTDFRARVRDIARANLAAVEGATVSEWDDIPEGALVLPVDDDDWFAPHIAVVLQGALRPDVDAYRWTSSYFEVPIDRRHALGVIRRRVLRAPASPNICSTNNYAMPKRDDTADPLRWHAHACRWYERPEARILSLDERLSVMNRTLASQTSLRRRGSNLSRRHLVHKYHRYRALYGKPVPRGLEWSRPYVARMAELMEQFGPSR